MFTYTLKRIISTLPVLFIVSIIIFSIVHLTPGDPASFVLGDQATAQQVEELRDKMGLNEHAFTQYLNWLVNIFQGDFGTSLSTNQDVLSMIKNNSIPTLTLAVIAEIIAIIIAIPVGIIAAIRRGTITDQAVMGGALMGMAIPSFLLALLFILIFGVHFQWLPVAGYKPISDGLWDHLRYLILPAVSLGSIQAALLARMTRSSMLEVLHQDYIKMARAKGVKEYRIILSYGLRNGFLPILTVIGQTFGVLVTGAVIVETIFNIPGIGQLIINSIERRDYPVIQGIVLIVTLAYVVINLIIDLLYGVIDPRTRLEKDR